MNEKVTKALKIVKDITATVLDGTAIAFATGADLVRGKKKIKIEMYTNNSEEVN
jgi:hypothetical protein